MPYEDTVKTLTKQTGWKPTKNRLQFASGTDIPESIKHSDVILPSTFRKCRNCQRKKCMDISNWSFRLVIAAIAIECTKLSNLYFPAVLMKIFTSAAAFIIETKTSKSLFKLEFDETTISKFENNLTFLRDFWVRKSLPDTDTWAVFLLCNAKATGFYDSMLTLFEELGVPIFCDTTFL